MAAFLLLLLPALVLARIEVQLTGELDTTHGDYNASQLMKVYVSGKELGVISDMERESFKLSDANLKAAVESYFGKQPSEAYLRSPTPWGDLYQSYAWDQVLRTMVPKNARVLRVTSEPTVVLKQIFENKSSKQGTFNVGISQEVKNTVASKWRWEKELSIGNEIGIEVDMLMAELGSKASMSMTVGYGEESKKSQTQTVGSTSEVQVLLLPGQKVESHLLATKSSVLLEVDYEANLSGKVAVNYDEAFKGHHFWSFDIQAVMANYGLKNHIKSKQIVEIGFYSNAQVIVNDIMTQKKLLSVAF